SALVFKVVSDSHGDLTYMRVYSGAVKKGERALNSGNGKREIISRMFEMHAKERIPLEEAHAGQIVAVIGCMAERDGDGLLDKMPHVDILCGPSELHRLPGLVRDVEATRERAIALSGRLREHTTSTIAKVEHDDLEALDSSRHFGVSQHAAVPKIFGRHQAYVRITRGCNKFCTFCVVPYTRGPEQ
ncbi:MAG: hypothetical protein KDA30_15930, partial [Phycisphaerales bacterium]|nr:hypothetical protein [Phycisphaerales bacterium]